MSHMPSIPIFVELFEQLLQPRKLKDIGATETEASWICDADMSAARNWKVFRTVCCLQWINVQCRVVWVLHMPWAMFFALGQ